MDRIRIKSQKALKNCDNYGVGVIKNGEMHITPLKGIYDMRPQLNYWSKVDKKDNDDLGEGIFNIPES